MDSILEQQRLYHEERDRLQLAMVRERMSTGKTQKEKVLCEHRIRRMMERVAFLSRKLLDLYEDKGGVREREIKALSGADEFSEFYTRLKHIRDYHRRHPGEIAQPMQLDFQPPAETDGKPVAAAASLVEFSGEESYGRYLDLHVFHDMFVNLKGVFRMDYLEYIVRFDRLFDISRDVKATAPYRKYLDALLGYLTGFYSRTYPLYNIDEDMKNVALQFEQPWSEGSAPGWPKEEATVANNESVDLSRYGSAQELEALGMDVLKGALTAANLKCGGSLQQRAERLFSTKGLAADQYDKAILAPQKAGQKDRSSTDKELALKEAKVYRMAELLGAIRRTTRENVERKQARTAAELVEEEDEEAAVVVDESDEEEESTDLIYNPKGLPLGWDGKPIPYWLYKLHGLNIRYDCEICGNYSYRGPKAFQRHFSEWRHAHGMRCLGIPNTAHFHNVTLINDALALWTKLQSVKNVESFQAAEEEEYEDSQGNVVTKKTYEDLKRQGLL